MEMFQPNLTLRREPDGELTLDAVTLTPSTCYAAGPAYLGVPPNVRITAETLAVLLPIRTHFGRCAMVLTPVRHRLANLVATGKTSVLAFTTIDDRVVGSASLPIVPGCSVEPKNPLPIETSGWFAWVDDLPSGERVFNVVGTVVVPSPGYTASLEVASPQGINPKQLILDLHVAAKPGIWPQVVTSLHVGYQQRPYKGAYDTVFVREPDGDGVQFPVGGAF